MSLFISVDQDQVFIDGGESVDKPFSFTIGLGPQAAMDLATALLDASKAAGTYSQNSVWGSSHNRFLDDHVECINADITLHMSIQPSP